MSLPRGAMKIVRASSDNKDHGWSSNLANTSHSNLTNKSHSNLASKSYSNLANKSHSNLARPQTIGKRTAAAKDLDGQDYDDDLLETVDGQCMDEGQREPFQDCVDWDQSMDTGREVPVHDQSSWPKGPSRKRRPP